MAIDPMEAAEASERLMYDNETRILDLKDAQLEATEKIKKMIQDHTISILLGNKWTRLIELGSFLHLHKRIQKYASLVNTIATLSEAQTLLLQDQLQSLGGNIERCYHNSTGAYDTIYNLVTSMSRMRL